MVEKELNYRDIPMGYPLCFNIECTEKARCMHYQARLLTPEGGRHYGNAIFPSAWQHRECKCFRKKRLVRKAWGFTKLYNNVPRRDIAEARQCVHAFFGRGNGPYYRAHHGENMLSPEEQEKIIEILSHFGSTEGIGFDHYVMD